MSEQSRSRIDIVCTAFNRSSAIRPTIAGVLAQTVPDWTLLVVSDGSTDDTDDVVRAYTDPRIRLIRTGPHGHPGAPRNVGVAAASAPYVAYLDHDDVWRPEHLEVLLGRLETGAEVVATGCVRVDEYGVERERTGLADLVWHPEIQTVNVMFEPSRVGHVRGLLDEVGGWSTVHAGYEDWDLWFRIMRACHDVTLVADRTSVQMLGAATRRNALRAPHAVVVERVADESAARRAVDALRTPHHRAAARASFVDELCRWYADLEASDRYHAPPGTSVDAIGAHLNEEFFDAGKPCLLEQLVHAPLGDGTALFLPVWCTSAEHVREISRVVLRRWSGQRDYLRSLLAG